MKFEETLLPEKSDVMTLQNMIRKYNKQNFETANQTDFAIYIKDDSENVMGVFQEKYLVIGWIQNIQLFMRVCAEMGQVGIC